MKSVYFQGIECEDLIMHLAKLAILSGIDTLIADEEGNCSLSEVPLVRNAEVPDFDGLLLVRDRNYAGKKGHDLICLVTDVMPANARKLGREIGVEPDIVIVLDGCGNEKNGEHIMNLLKVRCRQVYIRENERDLAVRACLQEGIRYRLKDLSKGMRKGVICMGSEILGLDPAAVRRLIGKEKRWERSLNSDPVLRARPT